MIELYFLRHGPAEPRESWAGDDAARPLTDKGRELTRRVVSRLAKSGLALDVVVTSPYARARETAEIAVAGLPVADPLAVDEALEPGFATESLAAVLAGFPDARRVLLVGHEPDFSSIVGGLVGSADLVLRKSGIAMVEIEDARVSRGVLRWLVPPSLLS